MPETTERDRELRRKIGISRRDLLRRGAIVGGTLIWTVPLVESISRSAFAKKGSPQSVCCSCKIRNDGVFCVPASDLSRADTDRQCKAYCETKFGKGTGHTYMNGAPGTVCCDPSKGCRKGTKKHPC
jgi:hypothetical protein